MSPKLSVIEMLPKKLVGAAVVIENDKGQILLLKPRGKDGWLIPGGPCLEHESPRSACKRKTKEEIGADIDEPKLAGVFHSLRLSEDKQRYESVHFIFYIQDFNARAHSFKLANAFEKFDWLSPAKATALLEFPLNDRVRHTFRAYGAKTVAYVELVEPLKSE